MEAVPLDKSLQHVSYQNSHGMERVGICLEVGTGLQLLPE